MLTEAEVEAFHKRRIDLPAAGRQHLLDRLQRAEHDAVRHVDQAPAPHGLHHLRIEELGPWHPARLGRWTGSLTARELHPLPIVGEDRKSTRLNSSHSQISYAVFCLKK